MVKRLIIYSFILFVFHPLVMGQAENYTVRKAPFSTDKHAEFAPVYYSNGLVYTSNKKEGLFSYTGPGGEGFLDLYYVDTTVESNKMKPELFSKNLTSKFNDGPATFHPEENTAYFSRNLYIEGKRNVLSSPRNKLGLFSATLEDGEWGMVREFRFNSEWHNILSPFISPDGERLYFASDMLDGYGGTDLYYCEWNDGYWNRPVNMGSLINTAGNEAYPFENEAGDFFFSSDGHPGLGGKDIFYSRNMGEEWLSPVALNPPINSEQDDFGFITDALINKGYFSSGRDETIDIYGFTTVYPQVFYINYQRENNYCYTFRDTGFIEIDTTQLEYFWHFGDGEKAEGTIVKHCYPGPGDYKLSLDITDKITGRLFFRKFDYLISVNDIEQAFIECPSLLVKGENIKFSGLRSHLPGYTILNYTWDFGDGHREKGPRAVHMYSKEGEYDVSLVLTVRSEETGKTRRTSVSRKVKVLSNAIEKQYLQAEAANKIPEYEYYLESENTEINTLYSAEKKVNNITAFSIELINSKNRINRRDNLFRRLPDKYFLSERYNEKEEVYSYTVEQREDLMPLYPSWKELRELGFENAKVKLFQLSDPAERELFSIVKNFDLNTSLYFDRYERLTPNAYVLMDQVVKLLNKYPDITLEIGVHTDNLGNASRNLSLSQKRAEKLKEYLTARDIPANRVVAKGYGEVKPIAPNTYEVNRRVNRRVEFRLVGSD